MHTQKNVFQYMNIIKNKDKDAKYILKSLEKFFSYA